VRLPSEVMRPPSNVTRGDVTWNKRSTRPEKCRPRHLLDAPTRRVTAFLLSLNIAASSGRPVFLASFFSGAGLAGSAAKPSLATLMLWIAVVVGWSWLTTTSLRVRSSGSTVA
jgi:hypothetical protein